MTYNSSANSTITLQLISHHLTVDTFLSFVRNSPLKDDLSMLAAVPRIHHDSATSDSCTVFLDVADSKVGSRSRRLVNRSLQCGHRSCRILAAPLRVGLPCCQRCWTWGHPDNRCRERLLRCPICAGPHEKANHRQFAGCCNPRDKTKPRTPMGQDCPHPSKCVNCGKDHPADSRKYRFWANRFDGKWIKKQYSEVRGQRSAKTSDTNAGRTASSI